MNEILTPEDVNQINAQNAELRAECARLRASLARIKDATHPALRMNAGQAIWRMSQVHDAAMHALESEH